MIQQIAPHRLKFGDEKLFNGAEVCCCRTRQNVLTGEIPASFTPSDFRNTYPIIGFCGIDSTTTPVRYRIHEERKDAEQFSIEVETAAVTGFLKGGDVLVSDNAAIHTGRENSVLEDWLWDNFGIFHLVPSYTLTRVEPCRTGMEDLSKAFEDVSIGSFEDDWSSLSRVRC